MVKSEPSGLDLQIISMSMQIILIQRSRHGSLNMWLFRSIVVWSDQMGRPHVRRCSRNLRGHQSFTLGSVFLLTFSLNPQLKSCRFVLTSNVISTLARQGCYRRHAHCHSHGWSDPQNPYYHSSYSWRSVQVGRIQEVQGCYSWVKCGSQRRFLWSDALQGSSSQVLASAKESGHIWVFRERL